MTAQQIKSRFHKLIDKLEDETILNNIYQVILEYTKKVRSIDIIDELSEKQKQRLMNSIEQVKVGKTMSNDNVKMKLKNGLRNKVD
ncbi:MAG: hypothetical protein ABI462_09590 [Ignavibacteria bacterium]